MGIEKRIVNRRMARVVEERAGVGTTEIVSGWQAVLVDLLSRTHKNGPTWNMGLLARLYNYQEIHHIFI